MKSKKYTIKIGNKDVKFSEYIHESLDIGSGVVICLDPDSKNRRNVCMIDYNGKLVWKIEEAKIESVEGIVKDSYTGISLVGGVLKAFTWRGSVFEIEKKPEK